MALERPSPAARLTTGLESGDHHKSFFIITVSASAVLECLVEALQAAGSRIRRNSGYSMAQCPAHDDRHASLSFRVGHKGAVILHCHAGCEPEAVLEALGLEWGNLYPQGGRRISKKR